MLSTLISPIRHWILKHHRLRMQTIQYPIPKEEAVAAPPEPMTCKRPAWAITQKNALVHLNELQPGLRYEIMSKTGPLHAPVFSVVNGFHFEGRGPTKKQAKMRVAELALRSFIQFQNASQAHASIGNFTSTPVDFTADKLDIHDAFLKEFEPSLLENCQLLQCNTAKKEVFSSIYNYRRVVRLKLDFSSTKPKRQAISTSLLEHLSPVALLNELRPGLRYMCLTERVHGRPMRSFVMVVRVEGGCLKGVVTVNGRQNPRQQQPPCSPFTT
ncbi:hypothetical protein F7725_011025 [Dissostichus mawsoni]|uniref:DRBM domain-containing protein n=1 Tax=Dissostichus mawsoni TaxID=36200 RepID=A0A7J5Z7N9_DISMA|nr:hypothetical protein F7725_011025 [Dissostichus mawsoni]